jgi:hypothetical protein
MLKSPVAPGDVAADLRADDRSALVQSPETNGGTGPPEGVEGSYADPIVVAERLASAVDPVLLQVADEVRDDPGAAGLLLQGSRAVGLNSPVSNYNFITVLHDAAYEQRCERGTLVEWRFRSKSPIVEITFESLDGLRRRARDGGTRAGVFASSIVVLDKSGEIAALASAVVAGGEPANELVTEEYDRYLNGFAHSLKSSSRGDDLGARAHAAESALHLVRALFALEGKSPPYLDQLWVQLSVLDDAQGWRAGFLRGALLRLLYAPDPPFQQMLDRRVSRLMDSRGIRHEWRHDLELLRLVKYDEL